MTTRGQIIGDAYETLGLASYVFDLTPDELATAFRLLDRMMAQWEGDGVALGYEAATGTPALGDAMTTPAYADEAVALNLALRLAPGQGKQPAGGLLRQARTAYALVRGRTLDVPRVQSARSPVRGGGDRRWWTNGDAVVTSEDSIVTYPDD